MGPHLTKPAYSGTPLIHAVTYLHKIMSIHQSTNFHLGPHLVPGNFMMSPPPNLLTVAPFSYTYTNASGPRPS